MIKATIIQQKENQEKILNQYNNNNNYEFN